MTMNSTDSTGTTTSMSARDLADLRGAVERLEYPGFAARLTDLIGQPIEQIVRHLPARGGEQLQRTVRAALENLLDVAIRSLEPRAAGGARDLHHKLASGVSGAFGGFFGAPGLAVELPISTTIMLRSIADIARSEGEDLQNLEARLSCLEVFALGGRTESDDAAETGYYAVRAGLAKIIGDAVNQLTERGMAGRSAPVIGRLLGRITSRFGAAVSEKMAAQAVPVLGAIGGATINLLFVDHFQDVARGHFTVRRLERRYGNAPVQREYERIRTELTGSSRRGRA
jgi:hypothetical protein